MSTGENQSQKVVAKSAFSDANHLLRCDVHPLYSAAHQWTLQHRRRRLSFLRLNRGEGRKVNKLGKKFRVPKVRLWILTIHSPTNKMQASTSRSSMLIRQVAQRASTRSVPACCSCESIPSSSSTASYYHPTLVRYAASKAKAAPPKKKSAAGSFNKKGKKGAAATEGGGERVEALKQVRANLMVMIDL